MGEEVQYTVRPARREDAPAVTRIALAELPWSRIYELGPAFANLLHAHMATSEHCLLSVGERDGEVLGFLVGALDAKALFRQFLRRYGPQASLVLLPQLFRPRRAAVIARGLTYFPQAPPDDPPAEILSFAIDARAQRTGLGKALFRDLVRRYHEHGTAVLKVGTIDLDNEPSNRFFLKLGAQLLRTEELYAGKLVNVYVCDIPRMSAELA